MQRHIGYNNPNSYRCERTRNSGGEHITTGIVAALIPGSTALTTASTRRRARGQNNRPKADITGHAQHNGFPHKPFRKMAAMPGALKSGQKRPKTAIAA